MTAAAPGDPGPAGRRPGPLLVRLRSSLLLEILAGLLVAVVGASALTTFLETRLTRNALDAQARRLTASNLRVLEQASQVRERTMVADLRSLVNTLVRDGLTAGGRRTELIRLLGATHRPLGLDVLQVVDARGRPLYPPARAGVGLASPVEVEPVDRRAPSSRLLATEEGRWIQAVLLPIGNSPDAEMLLGGYEFGDELAYRLRGALDERGHVVLVAQGRVAGSTLVDPPVVPPGTNRAGGRLPSSPVIEQVGGVDTLVAYRPVGRVAGGVAGTLGVALADPDAPLASALADARLLAAVVLAVLALLVGWLFFRALVRPLLALKETAGRIAGGDLEASFEAAGSDEVADLARSLERMRLELRSQLDLIAEQAEALRHSSHRIVAAQDEERHRLARDLHDGIQQHLVVLRMGFGLAKEAAEREPAKGPRSLEELGSELDTVIERLREVSQDLYPSILVDRGLAAALRSSIGRLPLSARLSSSPDPLPRLPPEIESGAYFLVGEAMTNVLKHAGALEITISLELSDTRLRVVVRDDGRGFDTTAPRRRGGLLHMQDRAQSFGGSLRIASARGAGTEVEATFALCRSAGVALSP